MQSTIIQTGTQFRFFDESVNTHQNLPLATYRVSFSPMSGFSLVKTESLTRAESKIYGNHVKRVERIVKSYENFDRSLGVLFTGDKGMGKSLALRMVALNIQEVYDLPIIIVDQYFDEVASFLDELGECVIVFDEFEKVFPKNSESNSQDQFLGLFDGMSSVKRCYVVSANDTNKLSDYFINRPGRFHYHLRFEYPGVDEIREYLADEAPNAKKKEIEKVVAFSRKVSINFDHLRAIAFELERGENFDEIIGDLNIKPDYDSMHNPSHKVKITFADGTSGSTSTHINLFDEVLGDADISVRHPSGRWVDILMDLSQVESENGDIVLNAGALSSSPGWNATELKKSQKAAKALIEPYGQRHLGY